MAARHARRRPRAQRQARTTWRPTPAPCSRCSVLLAPSASTTSRSPSRSSCRSRPLPTNAWQPRSQRSTPVRSSLQTDAGAFSSGSLRAPRAKTSPAATEPRRELEQRGPGQSGWTQVSGSQSLPSPGRLQTWPATKGRAALRPASGSARPTSGRCAAGRAAERSEAARTVGTSGLFGGARVRQLGSARRQRSSGWRPSWIRVTWRSFG